jgi:hypothetical protein
MYVTEVAVKDLVIDMPVDEANVAQKIASLQENGLVQPVTVWFNGMRIIDGFHRTVAAQRLGWNVIACNLIECNEEAFWDARIQSARQHQSITNDRLIAWISECWKATPFFEQFILDGNNQDAIASAANALWEIETKADTKRDDLTHVLTWFVEKANLWDMRLERLIGIVFGVFGVREREDKKELTDIAKKYDMSLSERAELEKQVSLRHIDGRKRGDISTEEVEEWLRKREEGEGLTQFIHRKKDEAERKKRKELDEAWERRKEYAASQEGIKERQEKQQAHAVSAITKYCDQLDTYVVSNREILRSLPEGSNLFLGLAEWAIKTANELYPGLNAQMPRVVPRPPRPPADVLALSELQMQ